MSKPLHVLIVEDSESDAALVARHLRQAGYEVHDEQVETAGQMQAALEKQAWDLVIADYRLPQFDAPAALALLQQTGLDIPCLVVSGTVGEDTAVAMMRAGAHDYLMKDKLLRLAPAVERELREAETRRERKRAEQALRESEERYRDLVENTYDLVCTHDLEGRILSVNRAATDLTGYAAGDLIGANFRDFLTPETHQDFDAYLAAIQKDGRARGLMQVHTKSGAKRIWEYHNTLRTQGLAAPIVRGYARDITEQRRAEKALRESERKLKEAQAIGRIGSWEFDVQGQRITWSDQTYQLYERDPASGPPTAEEEATYYSPEQVQVLREYARRALEEGANFEYDLEIKLPSGRCVHGAAKMQPVKDAHGRVIRLAGTIQDITERKRMEDALHESESSLQGILQSTADGILAVNRDNKVLYANERFVEMWMIPQEVMASKDDFALLRYVLDQLIDPSSFLHKVQELYRSNEASFDTLYFKDGRVFDRLSRPLMQGTELRGRVWSFRDITERKRAEEALRRAEEKYHSIFENALEGIYQSTPEGRFITANPALARMWGYESPQELIASITDIAGQVYIDPDRRADVQRALAEQDEAHGVEFQTRRKDGSAMWVSENMRAVRDAHGTLLYYEGTFEDITERRRAEEALQEVQQTLEAVVQASPLPILALGLDGNIILWNPAAERTFGWNEHQALGRQNPTVPREKMDESDAMFVQALQGKGVTGVETCRQKKDGSLIDASISTAPLRDSQGNIRGVMAVVADITERKQAEEALREAEAKYRALVEQIPCVVYMDASDETSSTIYVSPQIETMLGYTPDEWVASHEFWLELLYPDDRPRVLAEHVRTNATGEPFKLEYRLIARDGRSVWVRDEATIVRGSAGRPSVWQGVMFDITERKLVAEALAQERNLLRTVIDNLPDYIYVKDTESRYILSNAAHARFLRAATSDDNISKTVFDVYPQELAAQYYADDQAVIQSDQPMLYHDEPSLDPAGDKIWLSTTKVPLRDIQGKVIGLVGIGRDVTSRKQAEAALARRAEEMAALNELGQRLTARLDSAGVMEEAYRGATRLLDTANFSIALYDKDKDEISFPLEMGDGQRIEDDTTLSSIQGMTGYIIRNREPVLITQGAAQWRAERGIESIGSPRGAQSWLGVPMIAGNQVLGVLTVRNYAVPHAFDEHDRDLLAALANQMASALQNARLFEDIKSRLAQLTALQETTKAVASTLELGKLLHLITRQATTLLQGDGGILNLVDWEKREDEVVASSGSAANALGDRSSLENNLSGWVSLHNQPVISNQLQHDSRADVGADSWQSAAMAPLTVKDQVVGTLVVLDKQGGKGEFDQADLDLLIAFANQAAIAIQNVRLFEETKAALAETKTLAGALRVSQERFALAVRGSDDGLWDWDIRGKTLYWSPRLKELLGYADDELQIDFETFNSLMHPDDRAPTEAALEAHLKDRAPYDVEQRLLTKSGAYRWYQARGQAVWDETGDPLRMVGFTRDITERMRMERRLRDQVTTLQALTEIDREIIAATEPQLILELVCRRVTELLHAPKSAIAVRTSPAETEMLASYGLRDLEHIQEEITRLQQMGVMRPDVSRTPEAIALGDIPAGDPRMPEFRAREDVHAFAYAPLVAGDTALGALMVFDTVPHEWSADELQTLSMLAGQVAVALEKARLYQAAQSRARHLTTLNEIGQAITSTLDLDSVLTTMLDHARNVVNVEACSVALVESETGDPTTRPPSGDAGQALVFRQAVGAVSRAVIGQRLKFGQGIVGWVAAHRQPALALDVTSDPRFEGAVDSSTGFVTRSVACAPLVIHDAVIGVIELINKRQGVFGQDDIGLLQSIAAQAAIAIENAELFEAQRTERQRLEMLYRIGQAINSTLDSGAILDQLTEEAMRATHATHGSALVARPDLNCFERRSLRGYSPEEAARARDIQLPLDRGLSSRAYHTRQIVRVDDVQTDPEYFSLIPTTRTELVVPILRGGQALGNLDLQSPQAGAFRNVDLGFLQALTDQVAVALENARLFEEARVRAGDFAVLNELGQSLTARLSVEGVLQEVHRGVSRLVDAANFYVSLYDPGKNMVSFPLQVVDGKRVEPEAAASANLGLTGYLIRTRAPLLLRDKRPGAEEARLGAENVPYAGRSESKCWLGVPMIIGDQILGTMTVLSYTGPHAFDEHDQDMLVAIANQTAIALQNAQLYESAQSRARQLATLNEIGQAITSTLDLDNVLAALMDRVQNVVNVEACFVALVESETGDLVFRHAVGEAGQAAIGLRLKFGQGIVGWAAAHRQSVLAPDVASDPRFDSSVDSATGLVTHDMVCVPMVLHDAVIGIIELTNKQKSAFDQDDIQLLQAVAAQAAVAVENAQLFQVTRRRLDEMAVVSSVALLGAAGRPFDETVARATGALSRLWPDAPLGFLFVDAAGESLHAHPSYHGLQPETLGSLRIPLYQGIIGWAMQERRPIRVGDVGANPHYLDVGTGSRSEMVAPLVAGEGVIGAVNVESPQPDAFSGDDLRLLTTLAGQLATIFEKARLDAALEAERDSLARRVEERTAELRIANEQLREAHVQVSRALEKEKELGELKSRFVSTTSHEFRTPLTTILSSAEMLEHYASGWPEGRKLEHLRRIQAAVKNMTTLLNDVLIIGKAEANRIEFAPAPIDLLKFCREMVEEQQLADGARHVLTFAGQAECAQARMDENLLRHILSNSLSNAIKYSPQGSTVQFELTCRAGQAIFQITDQGIGIPPEDLVHLFEAFHRASNVRNIPGTGLGLTIVKRSVDLHGGTIRVASQVGVGTTVTVTLPTGVESDR